MLDFLLSSSPLGARLRRLFLQSSGVSNLVLVSGFWSGIGVWSQESGFRSLLASKCCEAPAAEIYRNLSPCSQVLVPFSDTGSDGQTLLGLPIHFQKSQEAVKTSPRRLRGSQDRSKTPKRTPIMIPNRYSGPSKTCEKHVVFVCVFR